VFRFLYNITYAWFAFGHDSWYGLLEQLDFDSNNRIFYHYTAGGAKLIKHTVPASGTATTTHYISNIVYEVPCKESGRKKTNIF
jgi:hypothetical protein